MIGRQAEWIGQVARDFESGATQFTYGWITMEHRFSTVRSADLIAVIDDGRVAELGNHAELMSLEGIYNELFSIQTRAYRTSFGR